MGCVLFQYLLLRRRRSLLIRTGTGLAMETGKSLQVTIGTQPPETFLAGCGNHIFSFHLVVVYKLSWIVETIDYYFASNTDFGGKNTELFFFGKRYN